jgi:hypothetical protein
MSKSCSQPEPTSNIQHIESFNDVVASFTRVRVRETVPDRVLEAAGMYGEETRHLCAQSLTQFLHVRQAGERANPARAAFCPELRCARSACVRTRVESGSYCSSRVPCRVSGSDSQPGAGVWVRARPPAPTSDVAKVDVAAVFAQRMKIVVEPTGCLIADAVFTKRHHRPGEPSGCC